MHNKKLITVLFLSFLLSGCTHNDIIIQSVLIDAGSNRSELEAVLNHYRTTDPAPQKLLAAKFLIKNLSAHYSYANTEIHEYYDYASLVLSDKTLTPEQQRDSLLAITNSKYSDLPNQKTPDAQIIRADFLIENIDKSYEQWKTCPWASQVTFDDYLEWMLPYKAVELQELDHWRDTLLNHFSDGLKKMIPNDVEYNTTIKVADIVRNEAQFKLNRYGLYTRAGLPLLNAHLQASQTFGNIPDYALTAALTFRSVGIPVVLDETPVGSRGTAATRWFVLLSDRGKEIPSEWDFSSIPGWGFFPYERGPKVFRMTYAINKERMEYKKKAKFVYPFELARKDVTDKYFLTSNLDLPIKREYRKCLKDKYVYIASAVRKNNDSAPNTLTPEPDGWKIVDFCKIKNRHANFKKMGREVMYLLLGYDGNGLIPITKPFILHKDGHIEPVDSGNTNLPQLDLFKNNTI